MADWIVKLIGGFIPGVSKPFPEWLGKILWVVGIYVALNIFTSHFFTTKNVTTVAKGGTQIIQQAEPRDTVGVGCNIFRLYIKGGLKSK